jgi:hypothetical protein
MRYLGWVGGPPILPVMRYLRSGCGSFWPVAGGVRGFGLLGVLGGMRHTRSPWPGPQPACTGRIRGEVVLAHRAVS